MVMVIIILLVTETSGTAEVEKEGVNRDWIPFSFAVIGDVPRLGDPGARANLSPVKAFLRLAESINNDSTIAFTIHLGDFKSDRVPCSDAVFRTWKWVCMHFSAPLVYIPGDNEWTDCWKPASGGFSPGERLQRLREFFFEQGHALGQRGRELSYINQSDVAQADNYRQFEENFRWTYNGLMFIALDIQGSNNNFPSPDSAGELRGDLDEFRQRNRACLSFLQDSFRKATSRGLKGIVVAFQGSPPQLERFSGDAGEGFKDIINCLAREAGRFNRPTLLIHGDTHYFRIDQPLKDEQGRTVKNFTRLENFGLDNSRWVKVQVNQQTTALFSFQIVEVSFP